MGFRGLKTSYGDRDVFYITPFGDKFKLHVEPAYRNNGTHNLDGYYPRYFKSIGAAKASLTKFLGKPPKWIDAQSNADFESFE